MPALKRTQAPLGLMSLFAANLNGLEIGSKLLMEKGASDSTPYLPLEDEEM